MNSGSVCWSSKCSPLPPNLFLSCTLLAVPVGSTLCMTFVSMATWVLLPLIPFDTCLCVWYYCCALLWFCWGVWHGLSESKTSIPFSYNFMVASIVLCMHTLHLINSCLHSCYCELCECELLVVSLCIVSGNAGGDWYNIMDYGGSSSSSIRIWCTPPCQFSTALCCETPVTRLSDLWAFACVTNVLSRLERAEMELFIPQARKLKEKCLYKGHELVIHSKVSTVSSHDIYYSSSPATLPSVNPKASGTINNWLVVIASCVI